MHQRRARFGTDAESYQRSEESEYSQGDAEMVLIISTLCAAVFLAVVLARRVRDRREMERHSITPEALHALLASSQEVVVIDIRQPLDLLGDSVIIPGAQWLAPEEVCANPSLLPKERDLVVYCTSRVIKPAEPSCIELSRWDSPESNSSMAVSMDGGPMASQSSRTRNPFISIQVKTNHLATARNWEGQRSMGQRSRAQ